MTRQDKLITPLDSVWMPPPPIEEGSIPDGPNAADVVAAELQEREMATKAPKEPKVENKPEGGENPSSAERVEAFELLEQIDAMATNGSIELRDTIRSLTEKIRKTI